MGNYFMTVFCLPVVLNALNCFIGAAWPETRVSCSSSARCCKHRKGAAFLETCPLTLPNGDSADSLPDLEVFQRRSTCVSSGRLGNL